MTLVTADVGWGGGKCQPRLSLVRQLSLWWHRGVLEPAFECQAGAAILRELSRSFENMRNKATARRKEGFDLLPQTLLS